MDPIEEIVMIGLDAAGIKYRVGGQNETGLDFDLASPLVSIEVKQFHSDRIAEQMSRAPNVIAIQGREAAKFFALLLSNMAKLNMK